MFLHIQRSDLIKDIKLSYTCNISNSFCNLMVSPLIFLFDGRFLTGDKETRITGIFSFDSSLLASRIKLSNGHVF